MKKVIILILAIILIIASVITVRNFSKKEENFNISQQEQAKEEKVVAEDRNIHMTVFGDVICHNTNFLGCV